MRRAGVATIALIAIIALCGVGCRTTNLDSGTKNRLDAFFSDLHERGLFDGAVVIGHGQDVLWEKGFGFANVERQSPFTTGTPADAASLAKTMTATVVIMLARDELLDLDAPVQRLLPELPYREITLRHLLSHTSGLPVMDYDYFDTFLPAGTIRTTEILLEVIASQKPALTSPPGSSFAYSSFGYDLAALAAARAVQKPFETLLHERVFRPLGIASAFLRPGRLSAFPDPRTMAYRRVDGNLQMHDVFDFESFHGGSNIYISARDLHRWNASFLDRPLLDDAGLTEALTPARVNDAASALTLGNWYRSTDGTAFCYSGHLQGFHSEVFRSTRSRWSIVYVSNNTIDPWLQHGIIRAVNTIVAGGTPQSPTSPAVDEIRKEERNGLAGSWLLSDGETLMIEYADQHLSITSHGVSYQMFQTGPRAFYVPGLDFVIGFTRGPGDAFTGIVVSSNFALRRGSRPPE